MTADSPDAFEPFDLPDPTGAWQPTPVCWKILDRHAARREWPALAEWVRWLVTRYTLTPRTLPPCWYRHGGLVEELSALRSGWLAAFAPDAPGSAPLDWHTMFASTRARLEESVSRNGCTKDAHTGEKIPGWVTAEDEAFAAAVDDDVAGREEIPQTPPWA